MMMKTPILKINGSLPSTGNDCFIGAKYGQWQRVCVFKQEMSLKKKMNRIKLTLYACYDEKTFRAIWKTIAAMDQGDIISKILLLMAKF